MSNFIPELCNFVSPLIGHTIGEDHVHSDKDGWYYYIPEKSLPQNHPLILNHYRGPLMLVLPHKDWALLEQNRVSVQDYIDSSVWSFGYFWGGGSLLNGIHWQPFEGGACGIHDTERISRYLRILRCRTHRVSSGYMPTAENCQHCPLQHCPFSKLDEKNAGSSWESEVQEVDDRIQFYEAVSQRIQETFGFEAISCMLHDGDSILLFAGFAKDTVSVYLPKNLLLDMMFHPGKHDTAELADSLSFDIGISWYYHKEDFVPAKIIPIPREELDAQFCYNFWKSDARFGWFPEDRVHVSFKEKISGLVKNFF